MEIVFIIFMGMMVILLSIGVGMVFKVERESRRTWEELERVLEGIRERNRIKKEGTGDNGEDIPVLGKGWDSGPVVDRKSKKGNILIPENLNEYEKELLKQFYDL